MDGSESKENLTDTSHRSSSPLIGGGRKFNLSHELHQSSSPALNRIRRRGWCWALLSNPCFWAFILCLPLTVIGAWQTFRPHKVKRTWLKQFPTQADFMPPIPYTPKTFARNTTFRGPSQEAQDAWDALLPSGGGFIETGDGSRPFAFVSGFHQMFCLNLIRNAIRDPSSANLSDAPPSTSTASSSSIRGLDDCFDFLRQTIMCRTDPALEDVPYGLDPTEDSQVTGWGTRHECKDWSLLVRWTEDHKPGSGEAKAKELEEKAEKEKARVEKEKAELGKNSSARQKKSGQRRHPYAVAPRELV